MAANSWSLVFLGQASSWNLVTAGSNNIPGRRQWSTISNDNIIGFKDEYCFSAYLLVRFLKMHSFSSCNTI
uniref:Uncharacterized protein n=1 Tax=Zea mays TaxID=4577 RepID=C0PAJ8_MAIZE|nr:unknown [Zea mays]